MKILKILNLKAIRQNNAEAVRRLKEEINPMLYLSGKEVYQIIDKVFEELK